MLDKERDGTLIYGAEDELADVRLGTIAAIKCLVREDTAGVLFDFLFDILNDSQDVRLRCMKLLSRISRRFQIRKTGHDVQWLVLSTGSHQRGHQDQAAACLIRVLTHLGYESLDELKTAFTQSIFRRFDSRTVLGILDGVIRRNRGLFGAGPVFSSAEHRESHAIEYLSDLLLMSRGVLGEHSLEEGDLRVLRSTMAEGECGELVELLGIFEEMRPGSVSELGEMNRRLRGTRTVTSVGRFLKESLVRLEEEGSFVSVWLIPYKFRFRKGDFERCVKHVNRRHMKHMNEVHTNGVHMNGRHTNRIHVKHMMSLAVKLIKAFIRHPSRMRIRECGVTVKRVAAGGDYPTEIWLKTRGRKGMKLVVEGEGGRMVFGLEREMKITIEEQGKLWCYVGLKLKGRIERVSGISDLIS